MESNISGLLIRCPARRNAGSIASYVTRVATQSGGLSNESEYMISYGWVLMFQEENGDVVVNTEMYKMLKDETGKAPIEEILEVEDIENMADYVVFQ